MASMGGDLIREARKRAGLTQRELAERAGTTQSAVARAESGRVDPGFETVRRMLRLCGFNLLVALDPYDDSDVAQAEALLKLPVEERMTQLVHTVDRFRRLRAEVLSQIG